MKRVAGVKFETGGKEYDFFTDLDNLKSGDPLVAETVNGLHIVRFVKYKLSSANATKWIIQKIDMLSHYARIDHEKQLSKVKTAMEQKRKSLEDKYIYQMLAREDAEMAVLLDRYNELSRVNPNAEKPVIYDGVNLNTVGYDSNKLF